MINKHSRAEFHAPAAYIISTRPLAEPGIFLEISTDNRLTVPVSHIYNIVFIQAEQAFLEKKGVAGDVSNLSS